jgi:1-acyl-sn-glycerol-3-phosphate acyltransferase
MPTPFATQLLAVCFLSLIGLALAVRVVIGLRRSPLTPIQTVLFWANYLVARILWRAEISGPFPIGSDKGAVVICNHHSSLDPSFIAITVQRPVHWMVAKEYCEHPAFRRLLKICEVIPVNRGGYDTAATKLAVRYAQQGELVGLFPEGRINNTDKLLLPGRPGAAMIALKARVPVVPCYISGSPYDGTPLGCLLMSAHVRLTIGRPLDLSPYHGRENDRTVLEELTKRFLVEIAQLAGEPDFQPELAGRFYKPGMEDLNSLNNHEPVG